MGDGDDYEVVTAVGGAEGFDAVADLCWAAVDGLTLHEFDVLTLSWRVVEGHRLFGRGNAFSVATLAHDVQASTAPG